MTPKTTKAAKAAPTLIIPGVANSNRLVLGPESSTASGSIATRARRRRVQTKAGVAPEGGASGQEGTGTPSADPLVQSERPAILAIASSDAEEDPSSNPDAEYEPSDGSIPEAELTSSIDNLSKSTTSLMVRDEMAVDQPSTKPSTRASSSSTPNGALPSNDLTIIEQEDWAEEVSIAEAKISRAKARKAMRKEKALQLKAAKLAALEADRLAGKPPPRQCLRCKTLHWEQTPCPPELATAPEQAAARTKTSSAGKRKRDEVENSSHKGGPGKGKGRISNVAINDDVTVRAIARRSSAPKIVPPEFQDGTHCYLNLPSFSPLWHKGKPLEKGFTVREIVLAMRAVGLMPIHAKNLGATLKWLIQFPSVSDAEKAVKKPFILRDIRVTLTPFYSEGPRYFLCKTKGFITWNDLIKSVHEYAPNAQFKLKGEEICGCGGDKCLLIFAQPQTFARISLIFKNAEFTVAFTPVGQLPPCAICEEAHSPISCPCLVPVPSPPDADSYYSNSIA